VTGRLSVAPAPITRVGAVVGARGGIAVGKANRRLSNAGPTVSWGPDACLVHVHWKRPSPQSVIRCVRVSVLLHKLRRSVRDIRMLCSLSRVGIMSWITRNHVSFTESGTGVAHRFFQTLFQLMSGQIFSMRMSPAFASDCRNVTRMSYILLLYVFSDFVKPCGVTYAESISRCRRYSNLAGILSLLRGFLLRLIRFHSLSQRDVGVAFFIPSACSRYRRRARHLAATWSKAHPPYSLGLYSVESGTRKVAPSYIYHDPAVLISRILSSEGGRVGAYTPPWLTKRCSHIESVVVAGGPCGTLLLLVRVCSGSHAPSC
jgi:hypothetical protein